MEIDSIKHLVPMNNMRPENIREVAQRAAVEVYPAGKKLFMVGDVAEQALYVLEGELDLQAADGRSLRILKGGESYASHKIAHTSPRKVNAICKTECKIMAIDAAFLDVMLTWDQTGSYEVKDLTATSTFSADDWMARLLQMKAFRKVPPSNLQAMFMRLEPMNVMPGQKIVTEGEEGDYFYILNEGQAMVTRKSPSQDKDIKLATLEAGSSFGEEALISDDKRNASITMLSAGNLMRLSKKDFQELLNAPLIKEITQADADAIIANNNGVYLDVRLPSEHQSHKIDPSMNIPLYMLRIKVDQLNADHPYILYCDNGQRSSVAAFVLTQKGYEVYVLKGGIPPKDAA